MKAFANKEVLVEFDKLPDGSNSVVVGKVVDWSDVGVVVLCNSDGKQRFIQWNRIVTLQDA